MSHSDRNRALENSENLPENMYLNEDLPYSIRRDNRLIRNKRSELFNLGVTFQTDWRNKVITTNDGRKISIVDGKFITKTQHVQPIVVPTSNNTSNHDNEPEGPASKRPKNGQSLDSQRTLRSNLGNSTNPGNSQSNIGENPPGRGGRGGRGGSGGRGGRGAGRGANRHNK